MAIELSTAGILVKWAVETTEGTRPTSGYSTLRGVKSIPDFNPEPSTIQVTPLAETEWHHYIPGLKDPGGPQALTVNDYADFRTDWGSLMTAYTTAHASNKALWIEYYVAPLAAQSVAKPSFFYSATPSELGFAGAEVDSALENQPYLTPNKIEGWAAASTTATP